MTDPLAPLRQRYAHWMSLDPAQVVSDRDEAAHDIRAMQLILRMERTDPPSWHRALAAAATGAAALCVDPRTGPGGEWHDSITDYCRGHIRKVTRRARGAHWVAAQELPGITIDLDGTQVRALVPGLVTELDPRISRLQVGGTDVEPDAMPPAWNQQTWNRQTARDQQSGADGVMRVWLAPGTSMTLGKAMAQTGHAGMIGVALMAGNDPQALTAWRDAGCPAVACRSTADDWAVLAAAVTDASSFPTAGLLGVRDAGFTEVDPGTVTVIAKAPVNNRPGAE